MRWRHTHQSHSFTVTDVRVADTAQAPHVTLAKAEVFASDWPEVDERSDDASLVR